MTGRIIKRECWEKQHFFRLENGVKVCIEWNQHYGEFIKRLDDKDGYWVASNGLQTLPERFHFVLEWKDEHNLIRPNFERVYS
jgi:hypothetical protein